MYVCIVLNPNLPCSFLQLPYSSSAHINTAASALSASLTINLIQLTRTVSLTLNLTPSQALPAQVLNLSPPVQAFTTVGQALTHPQSHHRPKILSPLFYTSLQFFFFFEIFKD